MKVLFMDMKDDEGCAMDLALRAQDQGHTVRYWMAKDHPVGTGLVDKPKDWKPSMDWADLIILTGNCDYPKGLEDYFEKGYPIFGTNPKAAELELDRGKGQELLQTLGIETIPYQVVSSPEEGIELLLEEDRPFAMKPWGGTADKAMTCIPHSVDEAIFTLTRWKQKGLFKGQLMMQECVEGVEIGIAGFFGPGGWSSVYEESFEHKKFMNDDKGGNTGEMGTIIRHVESSKLFDLLLEPLTDYLHMVKFVGDCNINCMVDEGGVPLPLEFTIRCGWPDMCIRQEVIKGDCMKWMVDLINGEDSLVVSPLIVAGVVMAHGDFPREDMPPREWSGYPISGIATKDYAHIHYQQVMHGPAPFEVGGKLKTMGAMLTAGTYPLVVTGTGKTVSAASRAAYAVLGGIRWPSNVMYRTDIGKRLEEQLPLLHKHGFAKGMQYG